MKSKIVLILLVLLAGRLAGQELPSEIIHYADTVVHDARIVTLDRDFSEVEALAIRDGRILATGSSERMLLMAGPRTAKIDLEGRLVIPGFIATDADNDFAGGNLYKDTLVGGRIGTTLRDISKPDVLNRVRLMLEGVAAGEHAFFRFDDNSQAMYLTRQELDEAAPNNPVMVTTGSFDSVLNTAMLEKLLARLPKDHPHILKDEQGEPSGRIFGMAMGVVGWDLRPWPKIDAAALAEQRRLTRNLNARGVTTMVGHIQGYTLAIFNAQHHRGELNIRVRGSHDLLRQNPYAEAYLRRIGNLIDFGLGDMVKIIGAGLSAIDSNHYSGSALTLDPKLSSGGFIFGPYGKNNWINYGGGDRRWDDPSLDRSQTEFASALAALKYGWNFAGMHNVGDGATEIWLEVIEKGLAQPDLAMEPNLKPFSLDHNLFWNDSQTERIKKHDVRRGLGKMFQRSDQGVEIYGDRLHDVQPVPDLIGQGLKVHIEGTEPLEEIQQYVTRRDEKGLLWGPDHAVDRRTALLMKTLWAARFIAEEDMLGSIEPGKHADMAVLGADYFEVPADEISEIPVLMTILGGRVVYDRR